MYVNQIYRAIKYYAQQSLVRSGVISAPLLIVDFICKIKLTPSSVKWEPSLINLWILHQSIKSYFFTPTIGYWLNKGIIISVISENLTIVKLTAGCLGYLYIIPAPLYSLLNSPLT